VTISSAGLILNRTDDQLVVLLPRGDGVGHGVSLTIGNQGASATFDFSAPTVQAALPAHAPTTGNVAVTLAGINYGTSPLPLTTTLWTAPPTVSIGGRPCPVISALPHVNHSSVTCMLPPGYGANLPVRLRVNGQADTAAPLITFSYDAPHVASVAPAGSPTSARGPGQWIDDAHVFTSIGDRLVGVVQGSNLGRSGVLSFDPTPASGPLTVRLVVPSVDVVPIAALWYLLAQANGSVAGVAGMTLSDAQMASYTAQSNASIVGGGDPLSADPAFRDVSRAWNDSLVVFLLPAGFGSSLAVSAVVGGQAGTTDAVFSFDPPVVTGFIRKNYDDEALHNCVVNASALSLVGLDAARRGAQPRVKTLYPGW
jgi:hypothetical protein